MKGKKSTHLKSSLGNQGSQAQPTAKNQKHRPEFFVQNYFAKR
jgi:hypothetical protein